MHSNVRQLLVFIHTKNAVRVKKRLSVVRFFSPMTENIVSAKPRVQDVLMVLNTAETNKEWKIEAN